MTSENYKLIAHRIKEPVAWEHPVNSIFGAQARRRWEEKSVTERERRVLDRLEQLPEKREFIRAIKEGIIELKNVDNWMMLAVQDVAQSQLYHAWREWWNSDEAKAIVGDGWLPAQN